MEILDLGALFQYFLLISIISLVSLLALLLYSNSYTRKKIKEFKQNEEAADYFTEIPFTYTGVKD